MGNKDYIVIPPILTVKVEDNIDIIIVRDTARRAASLLGFAPVAQAQLAGASSVLAELVLKTRTLHEMNFNGLQDGRRTGIRVSCSVPWLANVPADDVKRALEFKIGQLIDEIACIGEDEPVILLTMWLARNKNYLYPTAAGDNQGRSR